MLQASKFLNQLNHGGQKATKKDSLPEPKEKPKLESSAELEVPGKATRVLTYSVPLSTELNSSETKPNQNCPQVLHSFCLTPSSWITGSPIQKMQICTALEAEINGKENYNMYDVAINVEKS